MFGFLVIFSTYSYAKYGRGLIFSDGHPNRGWVSYFSRLPQIGGGVLFFTPSDLNRGFSYTRGRSYTRDFMVPLLLERKER